MRSSVASTFSCDLELAELRPAYRQATPRWPSRQEILPMWHSDARLMAFEDFGLQVLALAAADGGEEVGEVVLALALERAGPACPPGSNSEVPAMMPCVPSKIVPPS